MAEPQIVAVGGLGEDDDAARLIDDFVLGLTSKERPCICLVPTASAEAADLIAERVRSGEPSGLDKLADAVLTGRLSPQDAARKMIERR